MKPPPIPASEPAAPAKEPIPKESAEVVIGDGVFDNEEEEDDEEARRTVWILNRVIVGLRATFCSKNWFRSGRMTWVTLILHSALRLRLGAVTVTN
jgi:hypothetical protein